MSRTRIVKGKIFEVVENDLHYYSEASITESASGVYAEQGGEGISHSGDPGSPPPSPTLSKCAVFFRPTKEWKGEFGFDWIRVGDSKMETDVPYNGIIGEYGLIYATEKGAKFTADPKKYNSILKHYSTFSVYKGTYYVPNMTLNVGEQAILDTITHVEEKADKLHYVYNTDVFELTIMKQFTVKKGINHDDRALIIKCKKSFSSPETIRVIATKNKLMEKVGEIKILPNNNNKNINIVIIPVENNGYIGHFIPNEQQVLINALKQSYINPLIEAYKTPINVDSTWFNFWFKSGEKLNKSSIVSIHSHLDNAFYKIKGNKEKYSKYYRVYMLKGADIALNGEADHIDTPNSSVVVFDRPRNGRSVSTMAHELLHAMGLYHTFDNDSPYTFELYKTDNIMDYTHIKFKNRFSTNKFQWKKINPNLK